MVLFNAVYYTTPTCLPTQFIDPPNPQIYQPFYLSTICFFYIRYVSVYPDINIHRCVCTSFTRSSFDWPLKCRDCITWLRQENKRLGRVLPLHHPKGKKERTACSYKVTKERLIFWPLIYCISSGRGISRVHTSDVFSFLSFFPLYLAPKDQRNFFVSLIDLQFFFSSFLFFCVILLKRPQLLSIGYSQRCSTVALQQSLNLQITSRILAKAVVDRDIELLQYSIVQSGAQYPLLCPFSGPESRLRKRPLHRISSHLIWLHRIGDSLDRFYFILPYLTLVVYITLYSFAFFPFTIDASDPYQAISSLSLQTNYLVLSTNLFPIFL